MKNRKCITEQSNHLRGPPEVLFKLFFERITERTVNLWE